jgi:hypothetical protein
MSWVLNRSLELILSFDSVLLNPKSCNFRHCLSFSLNLSRSVYRLLLDFFVSRESKSKGN